jgi:ribosomal protein S12 methylthiotransferase
MKIGLLSLGCPKNLVDSEVMLGLAQQAGHELTNDASGADVLVVNTCAFIDSAKQESIDAILEMAQHKTNGACRRLIVTGCLAERYRDELRAQIPEIDAVLGTGEVPDIVKAIGDQGSGLRAEGRGHRAEGASPLTFFRASGTPALSALASSASASSALAPSTPARSTTPSYIYDADTPRLLATPKHYAYVKIAEGCDYKCAFCIIPTLRGAYRSRPADTIVREARMLAARGVKELLLISQDTTFYGIDRSAARSPACFASSMASMASSGSGCSISIRPRSTTRRSLPWRNAKRSAATSTCRCSTRRTRCSNE